MDYSHAINWVEILFTGLFTILGAGLGAYLAGRYAVNSVTKQLKYQDNLAQVEMLDNHLKINQEYLGKLSFCLASIESYTPHFDEKDLLSPDKNRIIFILEGLQRDIDMTIESLSKLNIDSMPYNYTSNYKSFLFNLNMISSHCSSLLIFINHKISSENNYGDNDLESYFNDQIKSCYEYLLIEKEALKINLESVEKRQEMAYEEYKNLNEEILNLVK